MKDSNGFGAENWSNTWVRYDQKNNIIEQVFHDLKMAGKLSYFLESCNVEATATAIEAVGAHWRQLPPKIDGITPFGQGDLMFFYLNSPYVKSLLPTVSDFIGENEFIENLAYAVPKLSTAYATVREFSTADDIDVPMIASLKMGRALVLSYDTGGGAGHYITVVYYNIRDRVFLCYDPWGGNKYCKNGGVLEKYPAAFFKARMQGHRARFMEIYV